MDPSTRFQDFSSSELILDPNYDGSLPPFLFPDSQTKRGKSLSDGDVRVVQQLQDDMSSFSIASNNYPNSNSMDRSGSSPPNFIPQRSAPPYPIDLVRKIRRMNLSGFAVGEMVLVRCNTNKWQHAEVIKVTEEGVRLWVPSARSAVDVPVQLLQTHLTKGVPPPMPLSRTRSLSLEPQHKIVSMPAPPSKKDGLEPTPPSYVKSPVHAVRPSHLSHRQLYQHVAVVGNCGFCNLPLQKGTPLASWSCGHKTHFACIENRFRVGLTNCALCSDDDPQKTPDSDRLMSSRGSISSVGSLASTSSNANSVFGDGSFGSSTRSESDDSNILEDAITVPNFVCICGNTSSMANMEEEPMLGQLCCPSCSYNPWRPAKSPLVSQRSLGKMANVSPSGRDSKNDFFPGLYGKSMFSQPLEANFGADQTPPRKSLYGQSSGNFERALRDINSDVGNDHSDYPRYEYAGADSPMKPWLDAQISNYSNAVQQFHAHDHGYQANNQEPFFDHASERSCMESSSGAEEITVGFTPSIKHPPKHRGGGGLRRTRSLGIEEDFNFGLFLSSHESPNQNDAMCSPSSVYNESYEGVPKHGGGSERAEHCSQGLQSRRVGISNAANGIGFGNDPGSQPYPRDRNLGFAFDLSSYRSSKGLGGGGGAAASDSLDGYTKEDKKKSTILSWNNDGPWISVIKDGQDLRQSADPMYMK